MVMAFEDGEQENVHLQDRRIVVMVWMKMCYGPQNNPFPVHCSALIIWAFWMFKTYQMKKKYLLCLRLRKQGGLKIVCLHQQKIYCSNTYSYLCEENVIHSRETKQL